MVSQPGAGVSGPRCIGLVLLSRRCCAAAPIQCARLPARADVAVRKRAKQSPAGRRPAASSLEDSLKRKAGTRRGYPRSTRGNGCVLHRSRASSLPDGPSRTRLPSRPKGTAHQSVRRHAPNPAGPRPRRCASPPGHGRRAPRRRNGSRWAPPTPGRVHHAGRTSTSNDRHAPAQANSALCRTGWYADAHAHSAWSASALRTRPSARVDRHDGPTAVPARRPDELVQVGASRQGPKQLGCCLPSPRRALRHRSPGP